MATPGGLASKALLRANKVADLAAESKSLKSPKPASGPWFTDSGEELFPLTEDSLSLPPVDGTVAPAPVTSNEKGVFLLGPLEDDPWYSPIDALAEEPPPPPPRVTRRAEDYEAERGPEETVADFLRRMKALASDASIERGAEVAARGVQRLERVLANRVAFGEMKPAAGVPAGHPANSELRDYADYLAVHGVDQRTIDAVLSGDLPMDRASRDARAAEMGLDPDVIWWRYDGPLKNEMRGFTGAGLSAVQQARHETKSLPELLLEPSHEGLVYAHVNPIAGKGGVQRPLPETIAYPLLGPADGIAGIDPVSPEQTRAFIDAQGRTSRKAKFHELQWLKEDDLQRMRKGPARPLFDGTRPDRLDRLADAHAGGGYSDFIELAGSQGVPHFTEAESRKMYTEPLMASGLKGTLVRDETGVSTAFTSAGSRMLRRSDLAPLDTRFRSSRNILQGLIGPAAIATQSGEDR